MKKCVLLLGLFATQAFAVNGVNPGSSLTTGPSSNHFSVFSASYNPAMAPLMVPEDERWRINYLPSFSIAAEIGNVNNFADDLDELIDLIDDPSSNTDSATETLDRFNDVLVRMGEEGYIKNSINLTIPITPTYFYSESLEGTFFVDFSLGAQASVLVLDDLLRLDEQNQSFTTNTSIYLKSGLENTLSVGFGKEVLSDHEWVSGRGRLYAGAQLNIIRLELSKQVTRLEDLDGAEISDVIRDEYDTNLETNTNVGIDLGLVWDADWYRAGLRLENINSPEFSYGDIGVNCESRPENTIERNSCEISRTFIAEGRLASSETHTKHALLSVDGLLKVTDRWMVSSALDLAEYDDIVGFENQWLNVAMTYDPISRYIPSSRIGYQKNLAGTKLSSFTFGFSFFKALSLDFEWGTDTVEAEGETAPRRLGFSLAFEESF